MIASFSAAFILPCSSPTVYCGKTLVAKVFVHFRRGFEVELCRFFDQRIDDVDLTAKLDLAFDAAGKRLCAGLRRRRRS